MRSTITNILLNTAPLFEASIGAEAIYNVFKHLDLKKLKIDLEKSLEDAGAQDKEKDQPPSRHHKGDDRAGIKPEWMFLSAIPVIPAALRPMVALDGGRHATSDVNDLYRRVINRNNRLKKLKEISAPDVIFTKRKKNPTRSRRCSY